MATQHNLAISSPAFAAEAQSFTLVSEKDRKKQRAELAHLTSLLKIVEKDLVKAKTGKSVHSKGSNGPSDTQFEAAMAKMALILQLLQVELIRFGQQKAQNDATISKAQVEEATKALKKLEAQLKKIHAEEVKREHASFWEKFAEVFVTAVIDVVSIAFGQPEIAAVATSMLILSLSGALKKVTDLLANNVLIPLLEDMGISKKAAKAIGDITAALTITLTIVVATWGVGSEGAISELGNAAEEVGTEMTTFSGQAIEESASLAEEAGETTASKAGQVIRALQRLRLNKGLRVMAAVQAASQTGLISDSVSLAMNSILEKAGYSKEKRKEIEEIITMVISLIATIASAAVAGSGISAAAKEVPSSVALLKAASHGAFAAIVGGTAAETFSGVMEGKTNIELGEYEAALAEIQADLTLIHSNTKMNSEETRTDQRFQADTMKQQNTSNRALTKLMKGEAALANLFTAHSPV